MLCGYEWGGKDGPDGAPQRAPLADAVFSNKVLRYGLDALAWPFDRRILRWFELWGHPLRRDDLGGDFEKCLIQTNWCNTQSARINGSILEKVLDPIQIQNFLDHVRKFQPRLLLLFGATLIKALQAPSVSAKFSDIVGAQTNGLELVQKPFNGRRFRVGFQSFGRCDVVCLPHPSGSRNLSDAYIALFSQEISARISAVKALKGLS